MSYEKPLPKINGDNSSFWEGCRSHELKFQQCTACGHVRWPPSGLCPECHGSQCHWLISKGVGTVYTFAIYHTVFHPGFANDIPYTVGVVALDEGPHLLTNIVGCQPDEVRCEMRVRVVWEDVDQGALPKFGPLTRH